VKPATLCTPGKLPRKGKLTVAKTVAAVSSGSVCTVTALRHG
jgi:hypothetical protein